MSYWVYLVECADHTYYCGYAKNLQQRISEHNDDKKGAKYTKARRPVQLVYSEQFETISDALKREYQIKKLTHTEKLLLVKQKP